MVVDHVISVHTSEDCELKCYLEDGCMSINIEPKGDRTYNYELSDSDHENAVKSTAIWLSVWKKWCSEKGIAKEIENYEPTQLNTLLERSNAEIKNKHG